MIEILKLIQKKKYIKDFTDSYEAVVALSGGVDSSFSLILAKKLGFNPIAVTVNPGTIVLPKQFKENIKLITAFVLVLEN